MPKKTDTNAETFTRTFSKPIQEYNAITRATESLNESTRKQYMFELLKYFIFLNQDPDQVITQRRNDLNLQNEQSEYYERKTSSFIKQLLKDGKSGLYTKTTLGRIQGFFSNNSRRYALDMRNLKIPKNRKKQKYSPSNEELRRVYNVADSARNKLLVSLMYHTGAAPIDVSSLDLEDLPTETWSYFELSRNKTGEVWRGIITPDISKDLTTYLLIRNSLHSKSKKLFLSHKGEFTSRTVSDTIQELFNRAGLSEIKGLKPTSLRDAFEDALVDANVNKKIKAALMGHTSDIEHEYGGVNKIKIAFINAMRKTYPFIALSLVPLDKAESLTARLEMLEKENSEIKTRLSEVDNRIKFISGYMEKSEKNQTEAIEILKSLISSVQTKIKEMDEAKKA